MGSLSHGGFNSFFSAKETQTAIIRYNSNWNHHERSSYSSGRNLISFLFMQFRALRGTMSASREQTKVKELVMFQIKTMRSKGYIFLRNRTKCLVNCKKLCVF